VITNVITIENATTLLLMEIYKWRMTVNNKYVNVTWIRKKEMRYEENSIIEELWSENDNMKETIDLNMI